jgi:hypothetical protein
MVDPVTISAIASVGASGASFIGNRRSQKAQEKQARRAGEAQRKALIYNLNIRRIQGNMIERQLRLNTKRFYSSQRARIAKSGAAFEGTPLLVLQNTVGVAEQDIQRNRWTTESDLELLRKQAEAAVQGGDVSGGSGTSLLQSGAQLLGSLARLGLFNGSPRNTTVSTSYGPPSLLADQPARWSNTILN